MICTACKLEDAGAIQLEWSMVSINCSTHWTHSNSIFKVCFRALVKFMIKSCLLFSEEGHLLNVDITLDPLDYLLSIVLAVTVYQLAPWLRVQLGPISIVSLFHYPIFNNVFIGFDHCTAFAAMIHEAGAWSRAIHNLQSNITS